MASRKPGPITTDVISITLIKCEGSRIRDFERDFEQQILGKALTFSLHEDGDWTTQQGGIGRCRPIVLGTTIGHYDYVLIAAASSAFVVSQFCIDILRGAYGKKSVPQFKDHIIDTNTTIVISAALNRPFVNRLLGERAHWGSK